MTNGQKIKECTYQSEVADILLHKVVLPMHNDISRIQRKIENEFRENGMTGITLTNCTQKELERQLLNNIYHWLTDDVDNGGV